MLDSTDDVHSRFALSNATVRFQTDRFQLEFDVNLDDLDLQRFLNDGFARLTLRVRCAQTFKLLHVAPRSLPARGLRQRYFAEIAQDDLAGKFSVEAVVVAGRDIADYWLDNQNADYGDARFEILEGDLLASAGVVTLNAEKAFDPLNPPLDSCFRFRSDPDVSSGIVMDFTNSDYVWVRFEAGLFEAFRAAAATPAQQISSFMFPALMATLTQIRYGFQEGDEVDDLAWVKALKDLASKRGVADEEPLVQAQAILEDPLGRTFKNVDEKDA